MIYSFNYLTMNYEQYNIDDRYYNIDNEYYNMIDLLHNELDLLENYLEQKQNKSIIHTDTKIYKQKNSILKECRNCKCMFDLVQKHHNYCSLVCYNKRFNYK